MTAGSLSSPANGWRRLLRQSSGGDHIVQVYQDRRFLAETVAEYVLAGLHRGEAAILVVRAENREMFVAELHRRGLPEEPVLVMLDAGETLARLMPGEMPEWPIFQEVVGGALAALGGQYPAVRAYGEMVDILWQSGRRQAAQRLEEFWNDLALVQRFSLFCSYRLDNLDPAAYGGPLECVCKAHTHLIPARDYARFDRVVGEAAKRVLDAPLAQMLLSFSSTQKPATQMPNGQAMLLWLMQNMPRAAERVLGEVRAAGAAL